MKKLFLLMAMIIAMIVLNAQTPLQKANKCYDDKNWQCAITLYLESIQNKTFAQKDDALIHYRVGYAYYSLDNFKDAITYFQKAIEKDPNYGAAYWNLGSSNYKLLNYQLAADAYEKAAGIYTDNSSLRSILYWRSSCLSKLKNYKEAIEVIKQSIQKDPMHDDGYLLAGDISYNLFKYADAVGYYSKCIELSPQDTKRNLLAIRHYWRGKSYYKLLKYDSAVLDFKKSIQYDPGYKNAYWDMAAVSYSQSKWQDAISQFTKTISMFDNDTISLASLYLFRGRSYKKNKEISKALADFETALEYNKNYTSAYEEKADIFYSQKEYTKAKDVYTSILGIANLYEYDLVWYYIQRARCFLSLKDTSKAESDLSNALYYDEFGDYPEIEIEKANIHFGRKNYKDAAYNYNLKLNNYYYSGTNGEMSVLFLRKGISNLYSNNFSLAATALDKSLFYDSLNLEAHRYLGEANYIQKNYSLAEKSFSNCIRLYKNVKDSLHIMYSYRAQVYFVQKLYNKALVDYEQAFKLQPGNATYAVSVGQLAFELKNYSKVISAFTTAIRLYKPEQKDQLAFLYYGRGRAYHEMKDKEKALLDFRKALELRPSYAEAQTWLTTVTNATY